MRFLTAFAVAVFLFAATQFLSHSILLAIAAGLIAFLFVVYFTRRGQGDYETFDQRHLARVRAADLVTLEALRAQNAQSYEHYTREAGDFPSFAESQGVTRSQRLEGAAEHVSRIHEEVTTHLLEEQACRDIFDEDEAEHARTLDPEILLYLDSQDQEFNALLDASTREFAEELWHGGIKTARAMWGSDVIDEILAQRRAKAS